MKGVLPLNEFQSTSCLFLILKVEHIVDRKHSSQSHQKGWCDALRYNTTLQSDHPGLYFRRPGAGGAHLPCAAPTPRQRGVSSAFCNFSERRSPAQRSAPTPPSLPPAQVAKGEERRREWV